jgi:hypothetical protein
MHIGRLIKNQLILLQYKYGIKIQFFNEWIIVDEWHWGTPLTLDSKLIPLKKHFIRFGKDIFTVFHLSFDRDTYTQIVIKFGMFGFRIHFSLEKSVEETSKEQKDSWDKAIKAAEKPQ